MSILSRVPYVAMNNRSKILGYFNRVASKQSLLCLIIVAIMSAPAIAFVFHSGTFFVVVVSNDFLVVAIDSRTHDPTDPSAPPNDRTCKITPLSNNVIFFYKGLGGARDDNGKAFSGESIARDIYIPTHSLNDLASRWGNKMADTYREIFAVNQDFVRHAPNGTIVNGYFGGTDLDGTIALADAKIIYSPSDGFRVELGRRNPPTNNALIHAYFDEIFSEFRNGGNTARARAAMAEIEAQAIGKSSAERMAITASAYVKAVRDWGNDATVGGDIASVIIERGQKWRWYRRPDFCPEHKDRS